MRGKTGPLKTAVLILGAVMGSGFVSGKEIYQFFSRFGKWGALGFVLAAAGICWMGCLAAGTAQAEGNPDPVAAACPFRGAASESPRVLARTILTGSLFVIYSGMLAAGGAAFCAEFGCPAWIGSLGIAAASLWAAAGGLDALQRSVGKLVPGLLAALLGIAAYCGFQAGFQIRTVKTDLLNNWAVSALLYLSYNFSAALPVMSALGARKPNKNSLRGGAALAALVMALCGLCIFRMLGTDPLSASSSPIPLLSIAARHGNGLRAVCSFLLIVSIFCAASNSLFGLTASLTAWTARKYTIAICALCGYAVSLIGFDGVIRWLYPLQGAAGLFLLVGTAVRRWQTAKNKSRSV